MSQQQDAAPVSHPAGRHYRVRGHRLWVETEGAGEPLVLLAGLGPAGSHVVFHPFFTALAGTHRLFYVDLHGRGRSDRPADLAEITFADDVADVAELIGQLGLGPVHVYGFSYGGLLGQALALGHPGLLRSLIIANSLHSPEMWQANHANINAELARQDPDTWDRITALRAQGMRSTDPQLAAEFAAAAQRPLRAGNDRPRGHLEVPRPGRPSQRPHHHRHGDHRPRRRRTRPLRDRHRVAVGRRPPRLRGPRPGDARRRRPGPGR